MDTLNDLPNPMASDPNRNGVVMKTALLSGQKSAFATMSADCVARKLPSKKLSLAAFWPIYLAAHRNPWSLALHVVGTSAALISLALAFALPNPWLLLLAPTFGYGLAWFGHTWLECNVPATFKHPVLSLRADLRMLWLACRGRLGPELQRTLPVEYAIARSEIRSWVISALRYGAYPSTILLALAVHYGLRSAGVLPVISGLVTSALALGLVGTLERAIPFRNEWTPNRRSIIDDSLFLLIVQTAQPLIVRSLFLIGLSSYSATGLPQISTLWPDHWPEPLQVVLLAVGADVLHYWYHRAAHKIPFLWRLHSVHHAPNLLYTLNVGRFHPLERTLHFVSDGVPFILLGAGPEVFSTYFVIWAVNGFFQHANCDVRLGVINHLICGPDLHRWHHSRLRGESNANFGLLLSIWDKLFGSWYLPKSRVVQTVGINGRPAARFFAEIRSTFSRRLEAQSQ